MSPMNSVIRVLERITLALAGLSLVAIMLVVSGDAIMRYAFRAPLQWAFDFVSYYPMVIAAFFPISDTYRSGDHIKIDVIQQLMPGWLRAALDVACSLLALIVFAIVTHGAMLESIQSFKSKEFLSGAIIWPTWLSKAAVPIGTAILVMRLAHHCLVLIARGRDPYVADEQTEHME